MRTDRLARIQARGRAAALVLLGATLAACSGGGVTPSATVSNTGGGSGGGGGTTVTPTGYTLFASNYVAYQSQTNGAYLHSVQNGDLYAGAGGNYNYGCYSSPQSDMDKTQFYAFQAQADGGGAPNCATTGSVPPNTSGDYFYVSIKAPGTNSPSATAVTPLDISQSNALLIQMGNTVPKGNANVFTVVLANDTSVAQNGSGLTASCSYDQTLGAVGAGSTSALGLLNYVIPLSKFTCTTGSMATLQATGVTSVAVKVTGDKNPNVAVGEFDTIAVGYVGFTI